MITAKEARQIKEEIQTSRLEKEALKILAEISHQIEQAARNEYNYYIWEKSNIPTLVREKLIQNGFLITWQNGMHLHGEKFRTEGWVITW